MSLFHVINSLLNAFRLKKKIGRELLFVNLYLSAPNYSISKKYYMNIYFIFPNLKLNNQYYHYVSLFSTSFFYRNPIFLSFWVKNRSFIFLFSEFLFYKKRKVDFEENKIINHLYDRNHIFGIGLIPKLKYKVGDTGLFKVNLEIRIMTWKMKYQFVLETGNWKPWFLVAEQKCNN